MKKAVTIELSADDRRSLESIVKARTSEIRHIERVRIVLLASEGKTNLEIADELAVGRYKVSRWRQRFSENGLQGWLKDAAGRGRKPRYTKERKEEIVKMTIEGKHEGRTHWSRESMAATIEMSPSTVGPIWADYGLKPHLHRTFKVSNDKQFVEKLEDVVGLYMNPPENAIVFSCDEKSQIQALDRTQLGLTMKGDLIQTLTHDYKRNGTTSLFAALNTATGEVIGKCKDKHTHKEWIDFLRLINKLTPKDKDIHIICDNYATHKHPKVKSWLRYNKRFHVHFTPTSASWLNMVERFFRDLTVNALQRGVFQSVKSLTEAIHEYLDAHNKKPKPFIWTASATDILEKVKRARQSLHMTHQK